jgi:uncharacterized protein with HEPN domain
MPRDPIIAAEDILKELEFLGKLTHDMPFERFAADGSAYRAASYSIQTFSEAARQLPESWTAEHPELPWHAIKATGNKLRHEYYRVSDVLLLDIMTKDAPLLGLAIGDMLRKYGPSSKT